MTQTKLRAYQLRAVRKLDEFGGRGLCLLEPGLGKTLISLWYARHYLNEWPIIVVCPASIKWNWQNECSKHIGMYAEILSGVKPPAKPGPRRNIYIVNYDILGPTKRGPGWLEYLKALKPQLLIIDETQYARQPRARRTRALKELSRCVPHVIGLSGTPLVNRPIELFPILNMLRPDLYPKLSVFGDRFCCPTWTQWGIIYNGATRLPELYRNLKQIAVRYRKADVLQDLPPKTRSIIPLEIENRGEYNRALKDFLGWLKTVDPGKARKAASAEKLCKMNELRRLAAFLKLKMALEWVDNFLASGEKLLTFAVHTAIVDQLMERYRHQVVKVDGSITGKRRQEAFDRFNKDPRIRLFVGNVDAAGVGWSCTSASSVAFLELPWSPGQITQCEDRCIGEGMPVLTPKGWVPIEQINAGDLVITHTGRKRRVLETHCKASIEPMAEIKVSGWPDKIVSTANHRFMTDTGAWIEAGNLRPGNRLADFGNPHKETLTTIPFDGKRYSSTFKGYWGVEQKNARLVKAPQQIEVTDDFLFTVGYFAGDGFAGVGEDKGRFISFSGNPQGKLSALDICVRWGESQGMKWGETRRGNSVERRCYSAEWAYWFRKHFGHTAHHKRLPSFTLQLNPEQSRMVLEGLRRSDGYTRNEKHSYSTISPILAGQVFILVNRAGFRASLSKEGKDKNQWIIRWSGKKGPRTAGGITSVFLRHPVSKEDGRKERVYDLSVDKDESFIVGNAIAHNCHGLFRGQEGIPVNSFFLIARDTIETTLCGILEEKARILDATLDGRRLEDSLSILDLLEKQMMRENQ